MEIHFYEANLLPKDCDHYFGWNETREAIIDKTETINTTQMGLLSTNLLGYGYRVFVHPWSEESYEIKLGENECTERRIRTTHNLFNLWKAGEFSNS
jgi:hypothetical protein